MTATNEEAMAKKDKRWQSNGSDGSGGSDSNDSDEQRDYGEVGDDGRWLSQSIK